MISSQVTPWNCCTLQTHCILSPRQLLPNWDKGSDTKTLLLNVSMEPVLPLLWFGFVRWNFWPIKHFGPTSKSQVLKNRSNSQNPWKCEEGGIQSLSQLHGPVSKTRADLEKYYKTLPLAPAGQCRYRQWCCSQIVFHWLPSPFSSPSFKALFFPLYCTVGLYPWRFTVMRRSRQRSKALLALKRLFLASYQVWQAPVHPSYSNSVSKLVTQPSWILASLSTLYNTHNSLIFTF